MRHPHGEVSATVRIQIATQACRTVPPKFAAMIDAATMARLQRLPRNEHAYWLGDRRPGDSPITHPGLDMVVWFDASQHKARSLRLVRHQEPPQALLDGLVEAMLDPASKAPAMIPGRVGVRRPAHQKLLSRALEPLGVPVELHRETRLLDDTYDAIARRSRQQARFLYLERGDLTPAELHRFFSAAAALWQANPWSRTRVKPEKMIRVGDTHCAIAGRKTRTLLFFPPRAAGEALRIVQLAWLPADQFAEEGWREVREHHLPLAEDRWFPLLADLQRGDDLLARGDELRALIPVLEALVVFIADMRRGENVYTLPDGATVQIEWPSLPQALLSESPASADNDDIADDESDRDTNDHALVQDMIKVQIISDAESRAREAAAMLRHWCSQLDARGPALTDEIRAAAHVELRDVGVSWLGETCAAPETGPAALATAWRAHFAELGELEAFEAVPLLEVGRGREGLAVIERVTRAHPHSGLVDLLCGRILAEHARRHADPKARRQAEWHLGRANTKLPRGSEPLATLLLESMARLHH
jgi:hypothetical protein